MNFLNNNSLESSHSLDIQKGVNEGLKGIEEQKLKLLQSFDGFSSFEDLMNSEMISLEEKQQVREKINTGFTFEKLQKYFSYYNEDTYDTEILFTLVDKKGIRDFLDYPTEKKESNKNISQKIEEVDNNLQSFKAQYSKVQNILQGLSKNNSEFGRIIEKLERIYNGDTSLNLQEVNQALSTYLSQGNHAQELFASLEGDIESYTTLYNFFSSMNDPVLKHTLSSIPHSPREANRARMQVETLLENTPYLPEPLPGKKIEKNGYTLSTQIEGNRTKGVDLSSLPPQTYIEGKNGYRVRTQTLGRELLDIRGAFTREKIKIDTQKQNFENKLTPLNQILTGNNKNELLERKEILEQKSKQTELSLEEQTEFEGLKNDIKEWESLEGRRDKLEVQLELLDQELSQREDDFLKYYTLFMRKQGGDIETQDEKAKETLDFLDATGCTHIKYNDFLKIQNMINTNPSYYGFSKPLILENGFGLSSTGSENNKQEFINFLNKFYPEEFRIPDISNGIGMMDARFRNNQGFEALKRYGILSQGGILQMGELKKKMIGEK